jgi:hypothetical protein
MKGFGGLRLAAVIFLVSLCAATARGQLAVNWYTIDGGGGTSSGGTFVVSGTIGQPDAGTMSGGIFVVNGGFWAGLGASGPHCGSADFDCDGDTATDFDIQSFFACLAGNCPPPPCDSTADFNGDGDSATDADIEAFFRVLAGGTC